MSPLAPARIGPPTARTIACLLLACLALVLTHACPAGASKADELRASIARQRELAKENKSELSRLTAEERRLFGELAKLEDKVNDLESRVWEQELVLADLMEAAEAMEAEGERLKAERERTVERLRGLLGELWPVHLTNLENRLRGLSTWAGADRRYTWLKTIYEATGVLLAELSQRTKELEANLAEQKRLAQAAREQLERVNARKDALLGDKIALVKGIQKVRAQQVDARAELDGVLSAITSLNYQLKALTTKKIAEFKGLLPWPAQGPVEVKYAPKATPPVRGIGLELPTDAPVRAVSWGKVVHNDTLRGFGKVVILYHGDDYYSLYAFLADSRVRNGQDVEKDEIIGEAGYYPPVKGSGLYFELRFRQKAINPLDWLIASP